MFPGRYREKNLPNFIGVLTILLLQLCHSSAINESHNWNGGEYDFIVVGAGAGGSTVASRIAEDGKYTVLLVEEGGLPHPDLEIPALSTKYAADRNYVNIYPSVPQRNAGLSNNGIVNYRTGKTMGGSTSVNGMVVNRGSPHGYDNWAALTGDESWSYSNMLKYFKKFENYTGDYPSDQRGFSGPITVSKSRHPVLMTEWLRAGVELGFTVADPNGPQTPSFAPIDYAQRNGRRVSSFTGYILPMLESSQSPNQQSSNLSPQSSNLQILINSKVSQVIFEKSDAVGIRIVRNSTEGTSLIFAKARKEIILSGGVVGTPMLLLKSGIGPKSVLSELQVPIVAELPVGRNFHDHIMVTQPMILNSSSGVISRDQELTPEAFRQFTETGYGPYSSSSGSSAQAFIASTLSTNRQWPDIQLTSNRYLFGLVDTSLTDELAEGESVVLWLAYLTRPKSRGTIIAEPSNPDQPLIDFQYFSHPDDLPTFVEGLKFVIKICEETKTFRSTGCRLPQSPLPQCRHFPYKSDKYFECYIKYRLGSGVHAVGTCRMGWGQSDPEAVVNTQLRVIGINRLRVVDASIIPTIVNANPQGAVYAIAEKASEMVLKHWSTQ